jgi:hypothetical protein
MDIVILCPKCHQTEPITMTEDAENNHNEVIVWYYCRKCDMGFSITLKPHIISIPEDI